MFRRIFFAAAMTAALMANIASPQPACAAPASRPAAFQPTRFSVVVEGSGPDVIMIPGLTSNRRVWDQAVASLGGRYRVHRLQIAGFGGEPARGNAEGPVLGPVVEELHAYIAANRLERVSVVGHSIGGLMALMLAQRHPEDVGKAMIVDALPFFGALFGPQATAETVAPQAAAFRDGIAGMSDEAFRAQQTATIASLAMTESARPALVADSLASDRGMVARAVYEDMTTDMRPALTSLGTPLTVVYAVNPHATEATYGVLMRSGYSGAIRVRFEPVEPSYHFIMLDQAERFAGLLGAFLSGLEDCGQTRMNAAGVAEPRHC
ncbi:MAG TPA: alpha/beta hydrolase [Allosphingosinicella sp.]